MTQIRGENPLTSNWIFLLLSSFSVSDQWTLTPRTLCIHRRSPRSLINDSSKLQPPDAIYDDRDGYCSIPFRVSWHNKRLRKGRIVLPLDILAAVPIYNLTNAVCLLWILRRLNFEHFGPHLGMPSLQSLSVQTQGTERCDAMSQGPDKNVSPNLSA
jgi:hypothetical protein